MFTWTYTFFIDIQENKKLWLFIIIMYLLQISPQQKYLVNCKLQGSEIQKMVAHVICSFLALILNKGNWLFSFWISQWTLTPFNNSNIGQNMFILWVLDISCWALAVGIINQFKYWAKPYIHFTDCVEIYSI